MNEWHNELRKRLKESHDEQAGVLFDRLVASGIINESGEVTGHVHRWDCKLALVEILLRKDETIQTVLGFMPVFGIPRQNQMEMEEYSRDTVVELLQSGRKVIAAKWNPRLKMWLMGPTVRLNSSNHLRVDDSEENVDDLSDLPENNALQDAV